MQKRIVERLSEIGWVCALMRIASLLLTVLVFIAFPAMLIAFIVKKLYLIALSLTLVCAVPFVLISVVRRLLNRPRPFESQGFTPILKREKGGCSFPSRHAFSASLIATVWLSVGTPIAILLYVCTLGISAIRYLSGVHYLSDLIAGIAIGVISGVIGTFLVFLI